jgi:hypothetical protein
MLPNQKTPAKEGPDEVSALLFGRSKIGKSEFCSQAPGALFLATEPGLNHLEVYQVPVRSWEELISACREIAEGKHTFRTIVIDTIDNAYRFCVDHVLRKLSIDHESEAAYGKAYALINSEFHRVLTRLAHLPYGLFLISHSQEREVETRTGKLTRIVPTLPERARQVVLALVDLILFADIENTVGADGKRIVRRVLRTKPTPHYEAGDRTGRLPDVLDLNYLAFAHAFLSKQQGAETNPSRAEAR